MQPARQSRAEQPTGAKAADDRLPRDKGVEGTWGIDSEAGPCFTEDSQGGQERRQALSALNLCHAQRLDFNFLGLVS